MNPPTIKKSKSNLKKKGFREDKKSDHIYYFFYHKDKKTGNYAKMSHPHCPDSENIPRHWITGMKKTLKLSKDDEVIKLLDCTLSEKEYCEYLKENCII